MRKRVKQLRTNDPTGMRNRVLDVAAGAFQAAGYGATSMHDITRQAAVSGGALYHHFPTKKALALAVISERVAAEVAETWIQAVREAPSAAVGILAVFERTIAQLDAAGAVGGCPLNNLALELSLADEEFRGAIAAEYGAWRQALAERLGQDAAAGHAPFAAQDPDGFATVVVAMFSGAMAIAKAEQRSSALRACADQLAIMMSGSGG